jgi:histidyl-tRNA synthetase
MDATKKFRTVRGVRDILPPDTSLWNWFEATARDVLESYNFREIRLPIFEETELFARSIGAETDVVNKEMYSFEDVRGDLSVLRETIRNFVLFDPDSLSHFRGLLGDFVDGVEAALGSGEIEHDEAARQGYEYFRNGVTHFASLLSSQDTEADETTRTFRLLKLAAAGVQLGGTVTLRPEATASVVRAYIEHGMQTWPSPVRLYYMGPMFRRERPQRGRYRQFYQIGAEVLGPNIGHYSVDAELLEMLDSLFKRCRLRDHTLLINSIGCKECRAVYIEEIRTTLEPVQAQLSPDSQRRLKTNALRILDSKIPGDQAVIARLPSILERLCAPCREHFEGVKAELDRRGVKFHVSPRLVRGLDYYVRTTFEITSPDLGAQNAICGGGRYDGLAEQLGGEKFRNVKGLGFAIGEDRVIDVLKALTPLQKAAPDVVVAWKGAQSREAADRIAGALRQASVSVEVPLKAMSPGEAIGYADRAGIPVAIIMGPDEISAETLSLRLLSERQQILFKQEQLADRQLVRLLAFRTLLEREVDQLAIVAGVERQNRAAGSVVDELIKRGEIEGHLGLPIRRALDVFNSVAHREDVGPDDLSAGIAAAAMAVSELRKTHGRSRSSAG